jgi:hypothetical protein
MSDTPDLTTAQVAMVLKHLLNDLRHEMGVIGLDYVVMAHLLETVTRTMMRVTPVALEPDPSVVAPGLPKLSISEEDLREFVRGEEEANALDTALAEAVLGDGVLRAPSYTCPICGRVSYHPEDAANRYCGACHQWEKLEAEDAH